MKRNWVSRMMKKQVDWKIVRIIVIVIIWIWGLPAYTGRVNAFGTGAPNTPTVCHKRLPHHHAAGALVKPQTSPTLYHVNINVTSVSYNDVIRITLSTDKDDIYFRGFVVQVLPITDRLGLPDDHQDSVNPITDLHGMRPVGSFMEGDGAKLLSCFGQINTVTHKDDSPKKEVNLYWKAPVKDVFRPLVVKATILKEYNIFWEDIESVAITLPDIRMNGDPVSTWLKLITKTASFIHQGNTENWRNDIRARLKLGYQDMGNSNSGVVTEYLTRTLPYTGRFGGGTKNNGLYKSKLSKDDLMLDIDQLVREELMGDFKFSDRILEHLNEEIINDIDMDRLPMM